MPIACELRGWPRRLRSPHVRVAAQFLDLSVGQVDGLVAQQLTAARNRQHVWRALRFDHVVHGGVLS
jgi:hypothetical protein